MRTLNPCSARTIAALLLAFAVGGEAFAQALTPRAPIQKRPIDQVVATPGAVTGEIVVKFHDEALARLDASGNLSFNGPARGGQRAKQLLSGFSLSTAIKATHDEMYNVMQSAALHSGVASPDLPGMLSVKLDPESPAAIQKLARQLHALDCVEYATIMETLRPASVSLAGPAPVGSCAVTNVTPPLCLAGMTEAECDELDGTWNEGQESCGFLTPQLRWALAVSTSDSARHVLMAYPVLRVWMLAVSSSAPSWMLMTMATVNLTSTQSEKHSLATTQTG